MKQDISLFAYYLPQYYEIEFNNKYWGQGHTEWTVAENAKPLFKGHYQPHVPADLGFYNLLMPRARKAQADMAKEYGVDGFCYWHYWFGDGKTIMEKPFNAVVESKEPDFPFCLCWANHSWQNPQTKEIMISQQYLGEEDHKKHFYNLLGAFKDERYAKIGGKPIFGIFSPDSLPLIDQFIDLWNGFAQKEGFAGIYFIGLAQTPEEYQAICHYKLDAINVIRLKDFLLYQNKWKEFFKHKLGALHTYKYEDALRYFVSQEDKAENIIPTIISGWDHSPRAGKNSLILRNYTPALFQKHLENVFDILVQKENKICFIKAWNEWGEGNHLEPDLKYGLDFLKTLKQVKESYFKK